MSDKPNTIDFGAPTQFGAHLFRVEIPPARDESVVIIEDYGYRGLEGGIPRDEERVVLKRQDVVAVERVGLAIAGVDPVGSRAIRDLILKLRERGITVFLCSHLLEQVQEVCDHVGIIFKGKIVRAGRLEDLIAIEDQTEIILKDADPALLAQIAELVGKSTTASLIRTGKPRTTLERLFLRETSRDDS